MPGIRDHEPIVIEEFNGLYVNGDSDAVPLDHFIECENIMYFNQGFRTRPGIFPFLAIGDPVRMHNYVMQDGLTQLILTEAGKIFHRLQDGTIYGPILTIAAMEDFNVVSYAGRAYITPFFTDTGTGGNDYSRPVQNEFVYVYLGDGTPARKAAGDAPSGTLTLANSGSAGNIEKGVHVFAVAYETNTGFITKSGGFADITAPGEEEVDISDIPVSPDSFVVARYILATKAIPASLFTGDLTGYEFFFVPGGRISDNTTTTLTVSFFDSELLESADSLLDLLEEIPASVGLAIYHNRMVASSFYDDPSLFRISNPGEPEAFDAVTGFQIVPLDGNPITIASEYRDILYVFKKTRTYAYSDNGLDPSQWPMVVIDNGIGASVHGIIPVLDSGGINLDFLLVIDRSGLMIFDGSYKRPELSWKIKDLWFSFDPNDYDYIQCANDTIGQVIYIIVPDIIDGNPQTIHLNKGCLLVGYYANGLNAEAIKWTAWRFDVDIASIVLVETNNLLLATNQLPI